MRATKILLPNCDWKVVERVKRRKRWKTQKLKGENRDAHLTCFEVRWKRRKERKGVEKCQTWQEGDTLNHIVHVHFCCCCTVSKVCWTVSEKNCFELLTLTFATMTLGGRISTDDCTNIFIFLHLIPKCQFVCALEVHQDEKYERSNCHFLFLVLWSTKKSAMFWVWSSAVGNLIPWSEWYSLSSNFHLQAIDPSTHFDTG